MAASEPGMRPRATPRPLRHLTPRGTRPLLHSLGTAEPYAGAATASPARTRESGVCSPASIAIRSRFSAGGSGHVA